MPPTRRVPIPRPHGETSTSSSISCDPSQEGPGTHPYRSTQVQEHEQGSANSGRARRRIKETAMTSMKGTVVINAYPTLRVHTYVSPRDGWLVTTPIIEGPEQLAIFDGQLL